MSPDPAPRSRYAFAAAFLACFVLAELVYSQLDPAAQARLVAWASTNVANLEHEPVLPLLVSAFVAPGYFAAWPVLIALALFGANRALGNARTALVCLAGQVIGSLVSEGIVAYRVDAGQLSAASRHLSDVGPSYVVVSAIVVALALRRQPPDHAPRRQPLHQQRGDWLARALAAVDLVILVFPGDIFGGLSQLDVAAVGHLTALLTAAAAAVLILRRRRNLPSSGAGAEPSLPAGISPHPRPGEDQAAT
ncbi:MAG TPA: rhomboid-like protein [Streptosporangiaceae bacterium]